ncbi:stp1: sugar transferase, PEP-CTERM/EpsH1 system associated [Solimicrobium silvestre]|uniref:Stp1: sugar transferase, PEP-CTERM/EpsH1 system associated n=2 Tax=Solimicrobium silvestre TaxID=2099400 RepID=A0A2S9H0M0_9BURK|nr:stp1: sugar transferase, PEP-CTERM/EpsH1 system associated [Solimicrobium silvestre]
MTKPAKENLLLLVHRIPFPPNKGDKIRSFHLLKHLLLNYQVHLGCFIDDDNDRQYVNTVKEMCGESYFGALHPLKAKVRSLGALLSNRPLSLDYYRDKQMQEWVDATLSKHQIQRVVVFSSAMAQFIEHVTQARRVIDFVDVDSDKWLQYAGKKIWPMSWLYQREGTQLLNYERRVARECDVSLFVSETEANLFKRLAPESSAKIDFFNNGVDTDYFSPELTHANPYNAGQQVIVFTGAMDYWPNIDAVQWFAQEVLPLIRERNPTACFYIVGTRPSDAVKNLTRQPGVHVTGSVPDVRPYLAHARVVVAPLRIARGIQNKVLEAMAMAKTVLVSAQALEGIEAELGRDLLMAQNAAQFAGYACLVLDGKQEELGSAARAKVLARYNWTANLSRVDALLDPDRSESSNINSQEQRY